MNFRHVRGTTLSTALARALGVSWALVLAWVCIVAERDHHPVFTSRFECGTDPEDILRPGELLDESTLRFIVKAHCSNPRFVSEKWIELHYGGAEIDVETKKVSIAGTTYYRIVSVGGDTAP